jgi:NADH dehydrogenase/NADH:ubiquinone oxidoreductase subunit G
MSVSSNELKKYHIQRGQYKAQITLLSKLIENIDQSTNLEEIKHNIRNRIKKLESTFETFLKIQVEIELIVCDEPEQLAIETEEGERIQNLYYKRISEAELVISEELIEKETSTNESIHLNVLNNKVSSMQSKAHIRLPTISLPTFDGTFTAWCSFFDAFNTLIHNNSDLTNIQRLTYLKSSLKGEPFELVSTLDITELNYNIALDTLKKRYDNKRRIINSHVSNILNIQSITRESATQLKDLINTMQTQINCLTSLGVKVKYWDAILISLIISKLDNNSVKE